MDYLNRLRQEGKLAPDERTGWSVYDFTTGEKLVTINEDEQFQTASLVKPFIATAFFYKVERGELTYNKESRHHLERMIQHSSNPSTNWVMRRVGGPQEVERILRQQYPEIFQEIQLVEYIPVGGKTYRNKAPVHDYSRLYYALRRRRSPAPSGDQTPDGFTETQPDLHGGAQAFRKAPRSTTRPAALRVSAVTWAS